jgi:N utilization substance protein A
LLGWKIDIKSEEEKRQEVQNAINLLSTGAPVSALIDYGLAEATVDALVKGDIGTVEKLGTMTPEQLEALEGIDEEAVNRIQQAINGYYGQEYGEPQAPEQEIVADVTEPNVTEQGVAEETAASEEAALQAGESAPSEAESEAGMEAAHPSDSIENAIESASGTMYEPVAPISLEGKQGPKGEQAAEEVSAPHDEPQAGR